MGLGTFIQFTAGTKAVATQVNDNFDAITTWANHNVTSENLGVLNNTLQFNLNTNVNGITIANSGNVASLLITQSDNLAVGEGIITIDDSTIDQTAVDAAEFRIKAKPASTIPAIWVTHGAVDTFKLTRTALNLSSAVTTTLGGPLVLSNPSVTGPINLSGNLSVTGKETINRTSTNQFLELANTTTSKSLTVTPETSSFDLNINDTASAYNFKINGVTKAKIDNNGLDGSYLKTNSVPMNALNGTIPASNRQPSALSSININSSGATSDTIAIATTSITTSANNKNVMVFLTGYGETALLQSSAATGVVGIKINGTAVSVNKIGTSASPAISAVYNIPVAGLTTVGVYIWVPGVGGTYTITAYKLGIVELN